MNYERIAAADSLAAASSLVVGLSVLFCTPNAWALASYHVLSSFFALVSSYALYPWKPSLCWNKDLFRATTAFASSLLLISILNYFFNNLDKAFIGKWFGIEELGYYTRGYYLALIPAAHLTQAVSPVAFNALRKVADEPVRMREAFLKISAVTACAAILIGFGFLAFSRTAIILAYGERWLPALPVLRVMIVFGMVKSIGPVCSAIFFLKEKPGMIAIATAAMMAAFLSVCVPLTIEFGTVGTAAAVAIAGLFSHALSFVLAFRLVRADARQASA